MWIAICWEKLVYPYPPNIHLLIEHLPYQVRLLTTVSQIRLFKLAPLLLWLYRDLIFAQTCLKSEILTGNCTMTLALSLQGQLNTLLISAFQLYGDHCSNDSSFFSFSNMRHLLAFLAISPSLTLMNNWSMLWSKPRVSQPQHYWHCMR